jgi:predicted phage terminase large subunit-like protein
MPRASEDDLLRSCCRDSYARFVKEAWHAVVKDPLVWNWHIQLACDELQAAYERVFRWEPKEYDLVTNQPPGTTKSLIHSVLSLPWAWTRMPHLRFLGASYSTTLAEKLSLLSRDVVKSEFYRRLAPEIQLREDKDTVAHFMNTAGGERYAASPKGTATGLIHAHVICLDDAMNPEQVLSEAETFNVNHWMSHTILNRKVDPQVTFVDFVGQRLAQGDATDEFVSVSDKVKWHKIPADLDYEVRPPGLRANYVDGLMDPVRRPQASLDAEKKKGLDYYAGQFGQDPVPAGGGKFRVQFLRCGRPPDRFKRIVRFWDRAATPEGRGMRSRASYTCGVLMAEDFEDYVWVLNVVRGRWDSYRRERVIHHAAVRDGKSVEIGIEQEPGSAGKDSALATVRRLRGWRVYPVPASGSKEVRADEFSVQVNAGLVWLPRKYRRGDSWVGWAKDYVDELRHWPMSKFKDQGDASGGAYNLLDRPAAYAGSVAGCKKKNSRGGGFRAGRVLH